MTKPENEGGFVSHLTELRKRLINSFIFLFIIFIICYFFSEYIYGFLVEPFSKADCSSMHIGGIMHADAVVKCDSVDDEVNQKLDSCEKPILNHSNDQIADNYLDFYNSLLAEE